MLRKKDPSKYFKITCLPHLDEWAKLAEECRKVPSVKQGCLELERYAEDSDDDVSQGKVADVQVDDRVHATSGG